MDPLILFKNGFNRTFMELKVPYPVKVEVEKRFQSHLYGIESSERDALTGIIR